MVMIVLSYGANNYIINVHVKLWFTLLGYTPSVEDISNVMKCDRKFYSKYKKIKNNLKKRKSNLRCFYTWSVRYALEVTRAGRLTGVVLRTSCVTPTECKAWRVITIQISRWILFCSKSLIKCLKERSCQALSHRTFFYWIAAQEKCKILVSKIQRCTCNPDAKIKTAS